MKSSAFSLCFFACTVCAFDVDDFFDQLDNTLTLSAFHDNFRARLSGTLDFEFYNFQQPPPGLIISSIDNPFNPRLTLFLDTQIGSQVYFLHNRDWIVVLTQPIRALRSGSTNTRCALHLGRMAA